MSTLGAQLDEMVEAFRRFSQVMAKAEPVMATSPEPAQIKVSFEPVETPMRGPREIDPNGKDPHEPGAKLDKGKVKAGVLLDFSRALWAVAEVGTHGMEKYTRGGWQFVPNGEERYEDAFMRHLLKLRVEPVDESGLDTLAHLAWNVLAYLELSLREAEEE